MDKVVQAVASRGFLLWMGRSGGAFLSRSPASSSSFATNLCARQGARANPARCFSAQPEDERGYIPLRNSMAKQLNLKPIEIPYPKMFRKRHKRMLQRLEFTRVRKPFAREIVQYSIVLSLPRSGIIVKSKSFSNSRRVCVVRVAVGSGGSKEANQRGQREEDGEKEREVAGCHGEEKGLGKLPQIQTRQQHRINLK
jgi:hypothetical protein